MKDSSLQPEEIEVIKKLDILRRPIPRDANAAARTRAGFYAALDDAFPSSATIAAPPHKRFSVAYFKELAAASVLKARMAFPALVVTLAALVFLFGGVSVAARAANSAVPGDALYGMKTGVEQARLTFAASPKDQGRLFLEFAQRRMEEIKAMVEARRYDQVPTLARDVQDYLDQAQASANSMAAQNAPAATELQASIDSVQAEFDGLLEQIRGQMPDGSLPNLQPKQDNVNGNQNEANTNGDANSNENDVNANGDNINGNINQNDNSFDDDQGNSNLNDAGGNVNDDNVSNSNDNSSQDDNNTNDAGGNNNGGDGENDNSKGGNDHIQP